MAYGVDSAMFFSGYLLAFGCILFAAVLVFLSSPKSAFLTESRTFRLIFVPVATLLITTVLSVTNDHDPEMWPMLKKYSIQKDWESWDPYEGGARDNYAVSMLLNYRDREPWGQWCCRWGLWHLTFFSIASFKCEQLPPKKRWMGTLYGLAMCVTLWTGYRQWTSAPFYRSIYWQCLNTHASAAFALLIMNIYENCTIWWPTTLGRIITIGWTIVGTAACVFICEKTAVGPWLAEIRGLPQYLPQADGTEMPVLTQTVVLEIFEYSNFFIHFLSIWLTAGPTKPKENVKTD